MDAVKILVDLGLMLDEAKVYYTLLESGFLPARIIARKTGIGRTLVYRNLARLEKLNLVQKKEQKKKVILFYPSHPSNLRELINQKESAITTAKTSFSQIIGKFTSEYNALVGRPNIKFYEDIYGVQELYNDVIEKGEDILLVRSPLDKQNEELKILVQKQIERQIKNNIKVRALTPLVSTTAKGIKSGESESNLVSRCIIPDGFEIPAQIVIYGNKVGIVSLKNSLITTIIENDDISETFKILFEKIWTLASPGSDKIKEKIELGHIQ